MKKGNKYNCYCYDGGNAKNNIGTYEVIEQGKVKFKMKKISGNNHWIDNKGSITIHYELTTKRIKDGELQEKINKNGISCGDDTRFGVYCNRQGIPFIFEKIE